MTVGEFKAFIDGMGVPEKDTPTVQQWARIIEKLETVQKEVVRETVPFRMPDDWALLHSLTKLHDKGADK